MDTIYSLFAWAFITVASGDKRWPIVVPLALPSNYRAGSIPFRSKKFKSLTITILCITLHRKIVWAIGRYFEGFVGSFYGFDIVIIVDSNHYSGKYPCWYILLCKSRRVSYHSSRRCFKVSLRILHSLIKREVASFKCLFLAIFASDITVLAVPTNYSIVHMLFRRSTPLFYM